MRFWNFISCRWPGRSSPAPQKVDCPGYATSQFNVGVAPQLTGWKHTAVSLHVRTGGN